MVTRKKRTLVVLDTNVFIRALRKRSIRSPSWRILRLWLSHKEIQLAVSDELIQEYLEIFERELGHDAETLSEWRIRFTTDSRVDLIGLAKRYSESRDPDDNLLLATAHAGQAEFLITNDRDLLDLPEEFQHRLPFQIVTPAEFMRWYEER
jgi:putative PIN family toxin of toxin-antitoxin system